MQSTKFFFLGMKVSDELGEYLENCEKKNLIFLNDSAYLEKIEVDGDKFIGRRIEQEGVQVHNIEDSSRNISSLVSRVAPEFKSIPLNTFLISLEEESTDADLIIQ